MDKNIVHNFTFARTELKYRLNSLVLHVGIGVSLTLLQIAEMITSKLPAEIIITESNDPRSYRQNSDKLIATNFNRSYSVENAIDELISKFQSGEVQEKDEFFTVKWMKTINLHK